MSDCAISRRSIQYVTVTIRNMAQNSILFRILHQNTMLQLFTLKIISWSKQSKNHWYTHDPCQTFREKIIVSLGVTKKAQRIFIERAERNEKRVTDWRLQSGVFVVFPTSGRALSWQPSPARREHSLFANYKVLKLLKHNITLVCHNINNNYPRYIQEDEYINSKRQNSLASTVCGNT